MCATVTQCTPPRWGEVLTNLQKRKKNPPPCGHDLGRKVPATPTMTTIINGGHFTNGGWRIRQVSDVLESYRMSMAKSKRKRDRLLRRFWKELRKVHVDFYRSNKLLYWVAYKKAVTMAVKYKQASYTCRKEIGTWLWSYTVALQLFQPLAQRCKALGLLLYCGVIYKATRGHRWIVYFSVFLYLSRTNKRNSCNSRPKVAA